MTQHMVRHLARVDPVLAGVIRAARGKPFAPHPECEPFQTLAQAIAHQQLNGTAANTIDRKSTRLNSSHSIASRMPSSA